MHYELCQKYTRPFTVLDIGANLGYFSLRLTEDFDCTAVALEGNYADWLLDTLNQNENTRVIMLEGTFSLADLETLAEVEHFDVVLGLSVVHHLNASFHDSVKVLRKLGDNLILELPVEDNACGQSVVQDISMPEDAELLGEGKSHLTAGTRPVVLLSGSKNSIDRQHLGLRGTYRPTPEITSTWHDKAVRFKDKEETRPWFRGINLFTYLKFNGRFPGVQTIARYLQESGPPARFHGDIAYWNLIFQGDGIELIDFDDDPKHLDYSDERAWAELIHNLISAGSRLG